MHKTHGGHNVIKIRLAGGRNPTEGRLPMYEHMTILLKELTSLTLRYIFIY